MNLLDYATKRSKGVAATLSNQAIRLLWTACIVAPSLGLTAEHKITPLTELPSVTFKVLPVTPVKEKSVEMKPVAAAKPAPKDKAFPDAAFLRAIKERETGNKWNGPAGKAGELGAYQFKESTWKELSSLPHKEARNPKAADAVAVKFLEKIKAEYKKNGIPVTPYTCALAWNGGIGSVVKDNVSKQAREYGEAVNNLTAYYPTEASYSR